MDVLCFYLASGASASRLHIWRQELHKSIFTTEGDLNARQIWKSKHFTRPGDRQREGVIQVVAANLEQWTTQVKREKAIYHTLNKLSVDVTRKVLVAEAWCPVSGIQRVRTALQEATQQTAGAVSPSSYFAFAFCFFSCLTGHVKYIKE